MSDELFRRMEHSLARQLELLEKVRSGLAEVTERRSQVRKQMDELQAQADKLGQQAEKALTMGRDDLAEMARARQAQAQDQIDELWRIYTPLRAEEDKLMRASANLQPRVDAFRARVEAVRGTAIASAEPADAASELAGRLGMLRELWEEGLLSKEQYDKKCLDVAKSLPWNASS